MRDPVQELRLRTVIRVSARLFNIQYSVQHYILTYNEKLTEKMFLCPRIIIRVGVRKRGVKLNKKKNNILELNKIN